MLWVDPTDPEVFAAVAGLADDESPEDPTPEEQLAVSRAVAVASEVLFLATGMRVHPAGENTEEFIGPKNVRSFTLAVGPVRQVVEIVTVDPASGAESPLEGTHRLVGSTVYRWGGTRQLSTGTSSFRRALGSSCAPGQVIYRVTYRYASTITLGARAALLAYARELFLATEDPNACSLPERTTSVTREGLSMELMTPQDFLDKGRVGLPFVDTWLAQANPKRALRPAAVYTPDSPPGVGIVRGQA